MRFIKEQLFTAVEQANLPEIQRIFDNNPVTIQHFFEVHQGNNLIGYADSLAVAGNLQQQLIPTWLEQKFKQFIPNQAHSASSWLNGIYYPVNSNKECKQQLTQFLNSTPEAELIEALPLHLHIAGSQKNWEIVFHIFSWLYQGIFWLDQEKPTRLLENPVIKCHFKKWTNTIVQSRTRDYSQENRLLFECLKLYMELVSIYFTPCLYDDILFIARKNNDQEIIDLFINKTLEALKDKKDGSIPITLAQADDWDMVLHICQHSNKGSPDYDKRLKKAIESCHHEMADYDLLVSCIKHLSEKPINARTENLPESRGNTALHLACMHSKPYLIMQLLNMSFTMSFTKNEAGQIPLELVADAGDFQTLQKMCSKINNAYGDEKFAVRGTALRKAVEALNSESDNTLLLAIIDDLLKCDVLVFPVTIATAKEKGFDQLADKLSRKDQSTVPLRIWNLYHKECQLTSSAPPPLVAKTPLKQDPSTLPLRKQHPVCEGTFFAPQLPPKKTRQPIAPPPPAKAQETVARVKTFITLYKKNNSWLHPGSQESRDLVTDLNGVVENVKDMNHAEKKIKTILRAFFHFRYSVCNFAETPTITQLIDCKITSKKTLAKMQKNYIVLANLFDEFSTQTFSTATSDKLIDDLKDIRDQFHKMPSNKQHNAIRTRCNEYLRDRIASGNTKKTDTVLLLQRHIGITDADIQTIYAQQHENKEYDLHLAGDLGKGKLEDNFFVMVPK